MAIVKLLVSICNGSPHIFFVLPTNHISLTRFSLTLLLCSLFFPPPSVRETHHIAQAQQEKNAKLREAFGISQYFVEGTSFDQDRKAKEDLAKSEALQKELAEKEKAKEMERANRKRYALVRTPSPEKEAGGGAGGSDRNGKQRRRGSSNDEREEGEHDDDDEEENDGSHDGGDGKVNNSKSTAGGGLRRDKEEKKKKKKKARDV